MPCRKLVTAAGLPTSVRNALPSRAWIGRGQLMPRSARMIHQAEEERQVARIRRAFRTA